MFDLMVIATVQIGALIYGVVTTYQQRPVAIVLIDQFVLSTVASSYGTQLESLDELQQYSSETPPFIYADMPQTQEALDELMRKKFKDQIPEASQVQLYQPPSMLPKGLQMRQADYSRLLGEVGAFEKLEAWLQQRQMQRENVLVAPFNGRYGLIWLIFDQKAKYLGYIG